jgi:hypothetical protein
MNKLKGFLFCLVILASISGLAAQSGEWAVRAGGSGI